MRLLPEPRVRAQRVLTPAGVVRDHVVERDGERIVAVRPARANDPPTREGVLIAGTVNAHTHLELSWLEAPFAGGDGLVPWVRAQLDRRGAVPENAREQALAAAQAMKAAGTVAVGDVSNGGDTAPILVQAGLQGTVHHEVLTLDRSRLPGALEVARRDARAADGVVTRPSPHAPYSTHPQLMTAAAAVEGPPGTIHLAEDPAELQFLQAGTGPFADLLADLGVDWSDWSPPALSPVAYLDALGLLGPDLLLVHAVHLGDADIAAIAAAGARVCLCPRSNLHIGGQLPPVPALLEAGVPLCLGTDSLGSSPDLDVLGEVAVLRQAFPAVDTAVWLQAATAGGADALGRPDLGRIAVGAAPGLVLLPPYPDIMGA